MNRQDIAYITDNPRIRPYAVEPPARRARRAGIPGGALPAGYILRMLWIRAMSLRPASKSTTTPTIVTARTSFHNFIAGSLSRLLPNAQFIPLSLADHSPDGIPAKLPCRTGPTALAPPRWPRRTGRRTGPPHWPRRTGPAALARAMMA